MVSDLVAERECGECRLCCIVPVIDEAEMQKQPGVTCRHCTKGDCDIYGSRPGVCRKYFCGWRRLAFLDDDWRPDKSGVLMESGNPDQFGPGSVVLVLVSNPLKTVRQHRFLDFIGRGIQQHNMALVLSLPGPPGKNASAAPLNTPEMKAAIARSRSDTRLALEKVLQRLNAHAHEPYVMRHGGNDFST